MSLPLPPDLGLDPNDDLVKGALAVLEWYRSRHDGAAPTAKLVRAWVKTYKGIGNVLQQIAKEGSLLRKEPVVVKRRGRPPRARTLEDLDRTPEREDY